MVDYYISKGFLIIEDNQINLSDVPQRAKQIIDAEKHIKMI